MSNRTNAPVVLGMLKTSMMFIIKVQYPGQKTDFQKVRFFRQDKKVFSIHRLVNGILTQIIWDINVPKLTMEEIPKECL